MSEKTAAKSGGFLADLCCFSMGLGVIVFVLRHFGEDTGMNVIRGRTIVGGVVLAVSAPAGGVDRLALLEQVVVILVPQLGPAVTGDGGDGGV